MLLMLLTNRFPGDAGSLSALIRTCPLRSACGHCVVPARKSRQPSPGFQSFCKRLNCAVAALASVCWCLPGKESLARTPPAAGDPLHFDWTTPAEGCRVLCAVQPSGGLSTILPGSPDTRAAGSQAVRGLHIFRSSAAEGAGIQGAFGALGVTLSLQKDSWQHFVKTPRNCPHSIRRTVCSLRTQAKHQTQ